MYFISIKIVQTWTILVLNRRRVRTNSVCEQIQFGFNVIFWNLRFNFVFAQFSRLTLVSNNFCSKLGDKDWLLRKREMEVVQSFSKATFRCNRTFDNVTHMKNTKNKLLCNSFCRQSISRNFRCDKESVAGFHCYSKKSEETSDSVIVRKVVDGVTELLRLFSQERCER